MTDWPSPVLRNLTVISAVGPDSELGRVLRVARLAQAAGAWPADGRALYIPVEVQYPCTVVKMAIQNVVQDAGCLVDVGIYDINKVRLTSAGATAQGAAGIQVFDVADVTLNPGIYFLAMYVDTDASSTETFMRTNLSVVFCQACGVSQQAVGSGSALPANATFAGGVLTTAYVPYIAAAVKTVF